MQDMLNLKAEFLSKFGATDPNEDLMCELMDHAIELFNNYFRMGSVESDPESNFEIGPAVDPPITKWVSIQMLQGGIGVMFF
jgi:hypothetical protein